MTSPTLPEEVVEEILIRINPDEPAHLVPATLVCKSWHRILSDDTFRRRYRRFHRTPPLQGYFWNCFSDSTIRFVPMTDVADASPVLTTPTDLSAVCEPNNVYNSSSQRRSALDCRHGRVLIQEDSSDRWVSPDRLIVWDPITGSQQHLSVPACPQCPNLYEYMYAGAVLCAKDNGDHLDCYGGPFRVVLVGMSYDYSKDYGSNEEEDVLTWAFVYSSETGAWSAPTTPNVKTKKRIDDMAPSLLVGDALYFNTERGGDSIVKYDLRKHELSVMDFPAVFDCCILIKRNDNGVGFATMLHNCIYTWSWQVDNRGIGGSLQYGVVKLDDTLLPEGAHQHDLICMAEGTNTVFIRVRGKGLFTLDLKSRQVTKIGGKAYYNHSRILPYMSFYSLKH